MSLDIQEALAKGRTVFVPNGDGTVTFTQPNGESWTAGRTREQAVAKEAAETAGNALIAELRAKRNAPLVETHTIGGIDYFLLRMDDTHRNLVWEHTVRWGDGTLRLDRPPVMGSFKRACIQFGTVQGERDLLPLFNLEPQVLDDALGNPITTTECELFCQEPDAPVQELFDLITDLNPVLWKDKKKVEEAGMKVIRGEI